MGGSQQILGVRSFDESDRLAHNFTQLSDVIIHQNANYFYDDCVNDRYTEFRVYVVVCCCLSV